MQGRAEVGGISGVVEPAEDSRGRLAFPLSPSALKRRRLAASSRSRLCLAGGAESEEASGSGCSLEVLVVVCNTLTKLCGYHPCDVACPRRTLAREGERKEGDEQGEPQTDGRREGRHDERSGGGGEGMGEGCPLLLVRLQPRVPSTGRHAPPCALVASKQVL